MSSESVEEGYFLVTLPVAPPMVVATDEQHERPPMQCMQPDEPAAGSVEEAFEEMCIHEPRDREEHEGKLLVVLDAANIGFAYGRGAGPGGRDKFDATGIKCAIEYFYLRCSNVICTAFIPAAFLRCRPGPGSTHSSVNGQNALMQTDEWERLDGMVQSGVLVVVPAGDDDDVYAIHYARLHAGFIVSNDLFGSHVHKVASTSKRKALQLWLQDNRCGYTFALGGEFLPNPSSGLVRALKITQGLERIDALGHVPAAVVTALHSLDAAVERLLACAAEGIARPSLLHTLLARALLRADCGLLQEAAADAEYCLFVDPGNAAAKHLMSNSLGMHSPT